MVEKLLNLSERSNINNEYLKLLVSEDLANEGIEFVESISKEWKDKISHLQFKISYQYQYIKASL